jgi:IS5 family transposase
MERQLTFTDAEYASRKKTTRRERFLKTMNEIIPWDDWIRLIEPFYPSGKRGRPTRGIETMLRMYLLQIWFSLSDEMTEDAIYDSYAMRCFAGVDFGAAQAPDATTLLRFRHLLEAHGLQEKMFSDLNAKLDERGYSMHGGTIVDATIIEAPSSTKNAKGERDPEMHSTKKGNQWHFGMKAHIGVDAGSGYVHTVTVTGANVSDIDEASELIRPEDDVVYGDSGYTGLGKREEMSERPMRYEIAARPGKTRQASSWDKAIERRKASVRSKVEHPFRVVKRLFGYGKVVYRGLYKNLCRFQMLFCMSNLLMLSQAGGWCRG